MTQQKLYFRNEDSDYCHAKEYFIGEMEDGSEMKVIEAIPDKCKDYFYCTEIGMVVLSSNGDNCGKNCLNYNPCNKKSGKCRFKTHCYMKGENKLIKRPWQQKTS